MAWWTLLAAAFVGIGSWWSRTRQASASAWSLPFWLGLAVTTAFLQMWHLFHAVDECVTAVVFLAGIGGLVVFRSEFSFRSWPFSLFGSTIWLIGVLWIANRSTGPSNQFDSLSYQLHATEWMRSFPVVPGLGNLHSRLALNNSSFLLAALVEPGPLRGQSSHFLNGFLIAGLWSQTVLALSRLAARQSIELSDAFLAVLLFPLVNDASFNRISSLGTDLPASVFLFVAVCMALNSREDTGTPVSVIAIVAFALTAVCMKVTALPFAGLLCAGVVLRALHRRSRNRAVLVGCSLVVAVWLGPWILHGVVMSGYPLFPLPILRANVNWAMPLEIVQATKNFVEDYGRSAGDEQTQFSAQAVAGDWIVHWVRRHVSISKADAIMPILVFLFALCWIAVKRSTRTLPYELLAVAVTAAVVWFVTAPIPRQGYGILWSAAGLAGAAALVSLSRQWRRFLTVGWVCFTAAALIVPLAQRGGLIASGNAPTIGVVIPRASVGSFHVPERMSRNQVFRTASGLEVQVPIQGLNGWRIVKLSDHVVIGQPLKTAYCWPGALLRTPFPNPGLRLRDPQSLSAGFMVEQRPGLAELLRTLR